MKTLRAITEADLGRESHPELWTNYEKRSAARAIIVDQQSRVALMHVTKKGYYKLPGGGVDPGETLEQTLFRELREEAGASNIEIISDIGTIIEYREAWEKIGTYYCYLVKVTGPLVSPNQTEKEIEHGYEVTWAKDIEEAIALVESGEPKEYGHDFEKLRELTFLTYAKSSGLVG